MNIETANRLYELRKEKGYSQEELAEKLNISRQAVSKWERAEASPDTDNLINLARLYGITLDELLSPGTADTELLEAPEAAADAFSSPDAEEGGYNKTLQMDIDLGGSTDRSTFLKRLPYGLILLIAYLCGGFIWGLWHPVWILLILFPVITGTMNAYKERDEYYGAFWNKLPISLVIVMLYLYLGFVLDKWHPGWIIFLFIPLYYGVVKAAFPNIREVKPNDEQNDD